MDAATIIPASVRIRMNSKKFPAPLGVFRLLDLRDFRVLRAAANGSVNFDRKGRVALPADFKIGRADFATLVAVSLMCIGGRFGHLCDDSQCFFQIEVTTDPHFGIGHGEFTETPRGILVEQFRRDAGIAKSVYDQLSIDQGFGDIDSFHWLQQKAGIISWIYTVTRVRRCLPPGAV